MSRARGWAGAQEHATCSAHAGRHGGVDLARSWRHVRSRSRSSGLGNLFTVSRQAWWRDDRDGGGRLRAGQTRMPTVAMATSRAAWGARAVSLQGGAGVRVRAGWRSSTGGQGRRLVEARKGERVLGRVSLELLPLPRYQLNRTRGKDFPQILWSQRGDLQTDLLPSLGQLARKRRKKERKSRARVFMAKIQI
jgi:hypothetical protein